MFQHYRDIIPESAPFSVWRSDLLMGVFSCSWIGSPFMSASTSLKADSSSVLGWSKRSSSWYWNRISFRRVMIGKSQLPGARAKGLHQPAGFWRRKWFRVCKPSSRLFSFLSARTLSFYESSVSAAMFFFNLSSSFLTVSGENIRRL